MNNRPTIISSNTRVDQDIATARFTLRYPERFTDKQVHYAVCVLVRDGDWSIEGYDAYGNGIHGGPDGPRIDRGRRFLGVNYR